MSDQPTIPIDPKELRKSHTMHRICRNLEKDDHPPYKLTMLYSHLIEDLHISATERCVCIYCTPLKLLLPTLVVSLTDLIFLEHMTTLSRKSKKTQKGLYEWVKARKVRISGVERSGCEVIDLLNHLINELQASVRKARELPRYNRNVPENKRVKYAHMKGTCEKIIQGLETLRQKAPTRCLRYCPRDCKTRNLEKTATKPANGEPESVASISRQSETSGSSSVAKKTE